MKTDNQNAFHISLLHPRYWLTWIALPLLWLLAWLPWRFRRLLGNWIGKIIYQKNKKRRHIIHTNLNLCFTNLNHKEKALLAQKALGEYVCAMLDYSILFFRSRTWSRSRIKIVGLEKLEAAIQEKQQNIVLLLGHSCWLEFAPTAIGQHFSCYGSYKPFKNAVLDWLIANSRLKDVEFVLPREAGMLKLVRSLRPGNLLFFLPDEDHGLKHSVFADFFGAPKATLTTPARIAKLGKAQCFPIMAFFDQDDGIYQIVIEDALINYGHNKPEEDAHQMNASFEKLIKLHPEQYLWQLKLFRTTPNNTLDTYSTDKVTN